ncbi:TPA: hypothetical protein SL218_004569 [Pseudomonas aeruginosa]|nr:hypothetical protein [Pseudomonas aeruginosa]HEJ2774325.1 hypothetical protein [Pseudomonas aeruginosa]
MVNPPRKSSATFEVGPTTRLLADRIYQGTEGPAESAMRPITISLPTWMIHQLEETAVQNKRSNDSNRSVSALIRLALIESGVLAGNVKREM